MITGPRRTVGDGGTAVGVGEGGWGVSVGPGGREEEVGLGWGVPVKGRAAAVSVGCLGVSVGTTGVSAGVVGVSAGDGDVAVGGDGDSVSVGGGGADVAVGFTGGTVGKGETGVNEGSKSSGVDVAKGTTWATEVGLASVVTTTVGSGVGDWLVLPLTGRCVSTHISTPAATSTLSTPKDAISAVRGAPLAGLGV